MIAFRDIKAAYQPIDRMPGARVALLLLPSILLLAISATEARAATYTVATSRDSMLKQAGPSENYATLTELLIKNSSGSDLHRPVYGFTLPVIPAGEVITSVSLRLWTTQSSNRVVSVHRITDTWAENTVTWGNTGTDFAATAEGSFTPLSTGVYYSVAVTSLVQGWYNASFANNGIMLVGAVGVDAKFTSREWGTANQRPQLVITTAAAPVLTVVKSSAVVSDPFNATTNPKAIPGAVIRYTINASNSANGTADNNSTVVTETVPSDLELFVGDYGAVGSGPLAFANGATSSGLTYSFVSLANGADSISFSNNGGASYSYTPIPDASGYDATVTNVRVNPSGSFAAKTGATDPSFQLQLLIRVK